MWLHHHRHPFTFNHNILDLFGFRIGIRIGWSFTVCGVATRLTVVVMIQKWFDARTFAPLANQNVNLFIFVQFKNWNGQCATRWSNTPWTKPTASSFCDYSTTQTFSIWTIHIFTSHTHTWFKAMSTYFQHLRIIIFGRHFPHLNPFVRLLFIDLDNATSFRIIVRFNAIERCWTLFAPHIACRQFNDCKQKQNQKHANKYLGNNLGNDQTKPVMATPTYWIDWQNLRAAFCLAIYVGHSNCSPVNGRPVCLSQSIPDSVKNHQLLHPNRFACPFELQIANNICLECNICFRIK